MLDIRKIRENRSEIENSLRRRGDYTLSAILNLDIKRRELLSKSDGLKSEKNKLSKVIPNLSERERDSLKSDLKSIGEAIALIDKELSSIEDKISYELLSTPNILLPDIPDGEDEQDNKELRRHGKIREFDFPVVCHDELAESLEILDLKRASKISGSRFSLMFGQGALLERALINFMLDLHTSKHRYKEVSVPFLVNTVSMQGTGQLPKFSDDLFKIEDKDLWLIPTAEVPISNIFADEILKESDLPVSFCSYTACFRKEAGSYGKDTKGLIRQHQFNKVELVKIVKPEDSFLAHEQLTSDAEAVLKLLDLPYRVVVLCSKDTGFSSAKTYDIEVWLPGQSLYREISSCSNFLDYQSRRMNLRYKSKSQKGTIYPHTLNGSGLAVGRTFVAILENYQNADGTVTIPEVLRRYMGGADKIVFKRD